MLQTEIKNKYIIPWYISQNNSDSNLISLCKSCHRKVEGITNTYINSNRTPDVIFNEIRRRLLFK